MSGRGWGRGFKVKGQGRLHDCQVFAILARPMAVCGFDFVRTLSFPELCVLAPMEDSYADVSLSV
jgi:hypothetical protein